MICQILSNREAVLELGSLWSDLAIFYLGFQMSMVPSKLKRPARSRKLRASRDAAAVSGRAPVIQRFVPRLFGA